MIHFAIIKYTVSHFFLNNFLNHFQITKNLCANKIQYRFTSNFAKFASCTPRNKKKEIYSVFRMHTPSKTSGAIHAALPLLFVMCVWISQAVPKSQIFRTVPPIINSRLEEEDHQM